MPGSRWTASTAAIGSSSVTRAISISKPSQQCEANDRCRTWPEREHDFCVREGRPGRAVPELPGPARRRQGPEVPQGRRACAGPALCLQQQLVLALEPGEEGEVRASTSLEQRHRILPTRRPSRRQLRRPASLLQEVYVGCRRLRVRFRLEQSPRFPAQARRRPERHCLRRAGYSGAERRARSSGVPLPPGFPWTRTAGALVPAAGSREPRRAACSALRPGRERMARTSGPISRRSSGAGCCSAISTTARMRKGHA